MGINAWQQKPKTKHFNMIIEDLLNTTYSTHLTLRKQLIIYSQIISVLHLFSVVDKRNSIQAPIQRHCSPWSRSRTERCFVQSPHPVANKCRTHTKCHINVYQTREWRNSWHSNASSVWLLNPRQTPTQPASFRYSAILTCTLVNLHWPNHFWHASEWF